MRIIFQKEDIVYEYPSLSFTLLKEEKRLKSLNHKGAPKEADTLLIRAYMGNSSGEFFYSFEYGKMTKEGFEKLGPIKKYSNKDLTNLLC